MPDANGKPQPGDPGYQSPGSTDPTKNTPGLIDSGTSSTGTTPGVPVTSYTPAIADATKAQAKSYDPNAFAVTSDQTVQGQLKNIVGADSPLIQQADTRAKQDMNARGLLNSSIASGAREASVIGSALPIAQQDAGTYNAAMTNTANAQNTAKQFGAAAENTASGVNAQLGTAVSQGNQAEVDKAFTTTVNNITQLTNTTLNNQTQMALGQLDSTTKISLGNLDAQNRQLLQTNANAANMFQDTIKNIAAIAVDPTLNKVAKDRATQTQINMLNEGLQTTTAVANTVPADIQNLKLDQYFQTINPVGGAIANSPEQANAPYATQRAALQDAVTNATTDAERAAAQTKLQNFNELHPVVA